MSHRLDLILINQKYAQTRARAQKMIRAGNVSVLIEGAWQIVEKPAAQFDNDIEIRVEDTEELRFVSRAGLKLEACLNQLNMDFSDKVALDIGQSTGGFTDCLLQFGVKKVVGIDVGHGQLSANLRQDKRVICLEGINARDLPAKQLLQYQAEGFDIVVMDVSFISQTLILPNLPQLMRRPSLLISLVKPQFELQANDIGKGGIVKDAKNYKKVELRIKSCLEGHNFNIKKFEASPILGGDGNKEFLVLASLSSFS